VLSRHINERIMIGGGITITVVDVRNGKVRLGIDAPKGTWIHREEVLRDIEREDRHEDQRKDI
jgi:carbon storage regulator